MNDLKQLYLQAKHGSSASISSYVEAVQSTFNSDPIDYILHLEYIISSDVGLRTLVPFIERYGFPIAAYDSTMNLLEKCITKCETQKKDSSLYKEAVDYLVSFKEKYQGAFDMYDYYSESTDEEYIRTYYGTSNGKPNRILATGMIKKFGEAAIPDLIITADKSGHGAAAKLESILLDDSHIENSMYCEWVQYASKGTLLHPEVGANTLSAIVEDCNLRNKQVYRESVLLNNKDAMYEYSEEEIDAIKDLIKFKEFVLTGMDESKIDSIMNEQREIYSLYESLDGVFFEEDDHVGDQKLEEKFVPVFAVIKSYSTDKLRNDGTPKNNNELTSVKFRKQISFLTRGDNYSHALIAFDENLEDMYSFDDEGIVHDSIMGDNGWLATDSIYICAIFVTEKERNRMKKFCKKTYEHADETKYAYSNLIRAYISKPIKNNKRFVCSTFTAFVLQFSNPKNLHRDYSRIRPEDITILPRSFYVMNVKDRNDFIKKKDEFKHRVHAIYDDNKEMIQDYNNELPKYILKDRMDKLKTIDKLLDFFISKI